MQECTRVCFLCVRFAPTEKTDGEVKGDFVLSLALTAQTKTKSHKLHDLDRNLLPLALALSLAQKHLDPVKAVSGRRF